VRLNRLLVALDARLKPAPVDPGHLARFAGTYEGRQVAQSGGRLTYARRVGGLGEELVPLGGTRFALGATQFEFGEAGGQVTLVIEQANGTRLTLKRD